MHLDRLITLRVVRPWHTLSRPAGRHLPILMYHRLADDPEPGIPPFKRLCTSAARFSEHMQWLADAGWRGVGVSEALAAAPPPGQAHRCCAITFDDGLLDFAVAAAPVLARHGFGATVYLPTAFIGDTRRSFQSHPCLTWDEVRELHRAGFEFGSHTVNHPRLHALPWSDVLHEVDASKAAIEQQLGARISGFSHPYAYPQADRRFAASMALALHLAGYTHGVTTAIGRAEPDAERFTLRRLPISGADDRDLFLAKVEGAYDWLGRPQAWSKTARYLATGRA